MIALYIFYDFKGNVPTSKLKLLDAPTLSDADWSTNPAISVEVFITTTGYDALNRPVQMTDPGGNINEYTYDRGGVLKTVKLNTDIYIADLHYDAKGQRQAVWYGNGTKTGYTYDPLTFRLKRLLTTGNAGTVIYQDLHYWYDPVGNITEIQDDAQQTLFFNNSVVTPTQEFTYDALYRLMEAKGRELIGTASFGAEDNWNDAAWQTTHKGNGSALQNYTQQYSYDEVGNILKLQHIAGTGSYTRDYTIDSASNRMKETEVGVNTYAYTYDTRGSMSEMPHLDEVKWNATNELCFIRRGSSHTHYQYSGGQRVRKFTDKGIVKEERIYLGSFEIYRKFEGSSLKVERQTVHLSDNSGRIAMLEKRTFGTDPSPASLLRYIYSNHLQSASLELDKNAAIISYEEYHPYGTTSYQAINASINAVAKRYRYTGKERDDESGLYYHGARYYIPWLARWTSVDALQGEMPTWSPYNYGFCNPVIFNDPSGNNPEGEDAQGGWYTDKQNNFVYVKGITTKEQFEVSEYKEKGTWFSTNGVSAGYFNIDNFNSDGTVLRTYNQSGIEVLYSSYKEYNKHKNDKDPNIKGWLEVAENTYKYVSYGYLQRNGIKGTLTSEIHDGITGKHYKSDGTIEKVKVYTSVSLPSTPQPQPTIVDTPIAAVPPTPPVSKNTEPVVPSSKKPEYTSDKIGDAKKIYDQALYVPQTAIEFGTTKPGISLSYGTSGSPNVSSLRYLSKVRNVVNKGGAAFSLINIGTGGFQAYYEWKEEGRVRTSTAIDIGVSATLLILSFTPLAPIAWVAGLMYGGIRLFKGDNIDNRFNKFQFW